MKRVALYVRVSTQEQKNHGLSVDNQIQALTDYAKENGYTIVDIYNDAGISARKKYTKRPALLRLVEDCRAGKVDMILFTKIDRWFRSVADYYDVQRVLDECSIPWKAIWEDYETVTSAGVFKVNIMLSVAQAEADRTSERIKSIYEYKRIKGDYPASHVMIGYKLIEGKVVKNDEYSECISAFFDKYLTTFSVSEAMAKAGEYGVILKRNHARQMLKSEIYCGNARGVQCEPYITLKQHNQIIESIENRKHSNENSERNIYIFTGILRCPECGKLMTGVPTKKIIKGKLYSYKAYKCSSRRNNKLLCSNVSTNYENKIARQLMDEIEDIINDYNISVSGVITDYNNIKSEIKKLKAKLSRIGVRFEEGDITVEEYREKRKVIKDKIRELELISEPATIITMPDDWKNIYDNLDDIHKKAFWASFIKKFYYKKREPLEVFLYT